MRTASNQTTTSWPPLLISFIKFQMPKNIQNIWSISTRCQELITLQSSDFIQTPILLSVLKTLLVWSTPCLILNLKMQEVVEDCPERIPLRRRLKKSSYHNSQQISIHLIQSKNLEPSKDQRVLVNLENMIWFHWIFSWVKNSKDSRWFSVL